MPVKQRSRNISVPWRGTGKWNNLIIRGISLKALHCPCGVISNPVTVFLAVAGFCYCGEMLWLVTESEQRETI
jgi:hypothetical protein